MAEPKAKPKGHQLGALKRSLKAFLEANPEASIQVLDLSVGSRGVIRSPWGDPSVSLLFFDENYSAAAKQLNNLRLPPRYRAIYHVDTKELEVIWTAWKLDDEQEEVRGRSFSLHIGEKTHQCEFGDSSERLMLLADMTIPLGISDSDFRNIRSFSQYLEAQREDDDDDELGREAYGKPTSFWIRDLEWDDGEVLKLIRHVNFYLQYYDTKSPVVVIEPIKPEQPANPRNRYFEGFDFPHEIQSRSLDQSLLILWGASFTISRPANFLNFYRIIEYVSYAYVQDAVKQEIKSIIRRPHALHDVERTASEIMLSMRELKTEREQDAILKLLKAAVDPGLLWREVNHNLAYFSKPTEFDGGVIVEPIVSEKELPETFRNRGVDQFARGLTQIRNALAHGKDSKTAKSILPTSYNFSLLEPWLHLIAIAAGEVVLWESTH